MRCFKASHWLSGHRRTRRRALLGAALVTLALNAPALAQQTPPPVAGPRLPAPAGGPSSTEPVRAEVIASVANGFARLEFRIAEDLEPQVRVSSGIVIITFTRPVALNLDRLAANVPGYLSVARRDPDGTALRLALARRVTVNTMVAGEKLFVDLLPEGWVGLPPPLPAEVLEDLSRRARDAERRQRQQQILAQQRRAPPVRIRAVAAPTFSRLVFDLVEIVPVTMTREGERVVLTFDAPLRFDATDVRADLPRGLRAIDVAASGEQAVVTLFVAPRTDLRSFREDEDFVVDLVVPDVAPAPRTVLPGAPPATAPAGAGDVPAAPPTPREAPEGRGAARPPVIRPVPEPQPRPTLPGETPRASAAPTPVAAPAQPAAPVPPAAPAAPPVPVTAPAPAVPAAPSAGPVPPAAPVAAPVPPAAPAPPAPAAMPAAGRAAAPPVVAAPETVPVRPAPGAPAVTAAAPAPPPPVAERAPAPAATPAPAQPVRVEMLRQGDNWRITFPFDAEVAGAVFRRGDTLFAVFDTSARIDISSLVASTTGPLRHLASQTQGEGQSFAFALSGPFVPSVTLEGSGYVITLAARPTSLPEPIALGRLLSGGGRGNVVAGLDRVGSLHRIPDPVIGDMLLAVTAFAPVRGLPMAQDFVEFRGLASAHGLALVPLADDLAVAVEPDRVTVDRPGGLVLSAAAFGAGRRGGNRAATLDLETWNQDRATEPALPRVRALLAAAAEAPANRRTALRIDLARFLMAQGLAQEAKGVVDLVLAEDPRSGFDPAVRLLELIAQVLSGRAEEALRLISQAPLATQPDTALWRAVVEARLDRFNDARATFRNAEPLVATLPPELQHVVLAEMARAAVELGEVDEAERLAREAEALGATPAQADHLRLIGGRVAELRGRNDDAVRLYTLIAGRESPAGIEGQVRRIGVEVAAGRKPRPQAIEDLEKIVLGWRGDSMEAEGLRLLADMQLAEKRWRDAFRTVRTAMKIFPRLESTRVMQDHAADAFRRLFLDDEADALPPVDALALYFDFRELTPAGRRGDEMIRKLADRLVAVDLVDQAADLLQHQIDQRLSGIARSQVATRLAYVHMLARRPERALAVLRATRLAELPTDVRDARLLLEARALAETGRPDLALELARSVSVPEGRKLEADLLWGAKRWREAGEAIETALAGRVAADAPLSAADRTDVVRAAISYGLADEPLALDRLRRSYGARMAGTTDERAFDVVTAPLAREGATFQEIARAIAGIDTLEKFLADYRRRYPEFGGTARPRAETPATGRAPPGTTASTRPPPPPRS
jgi:tetratricopeptide (TPR) repeat protein